MTHPLLTPSTDSWGTRYTNAKKALLELWHKALETYEGGSRIDMILFTQDFMKNKGNRPIISTFVYNIKNDMNEDDVEDMLLDIGRKEKGVED